MQSLATLNISTLNTFCRKYDLIFVETGRRDKEETYRFIDFNNKRRVYSSAEILDKISPSS